MDEASAAVNTQDGTEKRPRGGDDASQNHIVSSIEDTGDGVGIFCCQDCGEPFGEEVPYLEHCRQHLHNNMCLEEGLDNINNTQKDSKAANVCTLCSLSFVEPSEFHFHMEKNHSTNQQDSSTTINPEIKKQRLYECPECGKSYGVIGHYLNHQRSHRQAAKSVFHDLEHLKKKSFQCDSCGRNYSRASALDAHRRCHEEKLVKPRNRDLGDLCVAEESVVESKPSENQTDDNQTDDIPDKLFKCSCGKAFTALMRLKTHQRFSRNSQCSPEGMIEKPKKSGGEFYCSECKKAFSGHLGLFNHQRWHANHSNDSAQRFTCEECGKVFTTLTFYHKHQRSVHSNETPAKSFLHQVCQLQKKAFECKDCGLKFSRASALHSHELHHTDVFKETEKDAQRDASFPAQQKNVENETKDTKCEKVQSESLLPTTVAEHLHANESDEDVEHYEPGDFVVQVISASESEDETVQDPNPDLELLCESDQEVRDDEVVISPSNVVTDPAMDLKIVQIDYEEADAQCAPIAKETNNKMTEERFDCPDCYHWFSSAASLRVHRMWHAVRKRRQQTQVDRISLACKDCGLKFSDAVIFKTHLHQHALEDEMEEDAQEAEPGDSGNCVVELDSERDGSGENGGGGKDGGDVSSLKPEGSLEHTEAASMNDKHRNVYTCLVCGKVYTYLVSFRKHQEQHEKESSTAKTQKINSLQKYDCPECGMSFIRQVRLRGHLKTHSSQMEFDSNPPRCDQCNIEFTSTDQWLTHIELHEQKPFWCLRCAKGFADEKALDKHLQSHNQKQHTCNICHKRFHLVTELKDHYKAHTGTRAYQCTLCGKSFPFLGNLIAHRKKHLKVYGGANGMGIKNSGIYRKRVKKKKRLLLSSIKEEPEVDMNVAELPEIEKETTELPDEDVEFADSEDSDCGEPMHRSKPSRQPGSGGPDGSKLESEPLKVGQKQNEEESEGGHVHRGHNYWEWECCECDMGFDEVEKLHLHYIKHATGEVPIPRDDIEC